MKCTAQVAYKPYPGDTDRCRNEVGFIVVGKHLCHNHARSEALKFLLDNQIKICNVVVAEKLEY